MSVKIRLQRRGKKDQDLYRIVVMEKRSKMDGKTLAILGTVNPHTTPQTVKLDMDKFKVWISKGAQVNQSVSKLISL